MPDSGYPTDEELARIRTWPYEDASGWLAYIKSVGYYWPDDDWGWDEGPGRDVLGRDVRVFHVSTGGWSGNESIITAMRGNVLLWARTWQEHRRGGHYVFHLPMTEAA